VIAHVGGVPLEEALLPLVSVGGSGVLLALRALLRGPMRAPPPRRRGTG
jgi:hypothetical protein